MIRGEECVSQHKLVVMDMRIKRSTKKKAKGLRGRLKTWRLRSATEKEEFKCELEKIVVHGETTRDGILWNTVSRMQQRKYVDGRKGESNVKKRGGGTNRLQKLLRGKKRGIRNGGKTGVKRIWRHEVLKKEARQEVASAMESRRIEMANELEKGGSTMAFRIAKQRAKEKRDIIGVPCIQDENRNLKTEISERLEVWRGYVRG